MCSAHNPEEAHQTTIQLHQNSRCVANHRKIEKRVLITCIHAETAIRDIQDMGHWPTIHNIFTRRCPLDIVNTLACSGQNIHPMMLQTKKTTTQKCKKLGRWKMRPVADCQNNGQRERWSLVSYANASCGLCDSQYCFKRHASHQYRCDGNRWHNQSIENGMWNKQNVWRPNSWYKKCARISTFQTFGLGSPRQWRQH